jgi:hypothetical protein
MSYDETHRPLPESSSSGPGVFARGRGPGAKVFTDWRRDHDLPIVLLSESRFLTARGVEVLELYFFSIDIEITGDQIVKPTPGVEDLERYLFGLMSRSIDRSCYPHPIVLQSMERSVAPPGPAKRRSR